MNRQSYDHILLDSDFIAPLIRHFAHEEVLVAINKANAGGGMALVEKQRAGWWNTFQPAQSPLGPVIMLQRDGSGEAFMCLLRSLPGFALHISISQQDPDYAAISAIFDRRDIETIDYIDTARLELQGTFEEYWASRSHNLRHNLSRQRRRLAEKGEIVELTTEASPGGVAACIKEFGYLESRGWKGKEGTAVAEHNKQGAFYREVFENFCMHGEGVIYQLLLNGKVIASDLCLARGGMLVVLKTTYDEDVKGFSPALLMRQLIVQQLYERGEIRVIEFYGRVRDWHTQWTDSLRRMYHVNLFRSSWVARARQIARHMRETHRVPSAN